MRQFCGISTTVTLAGSRDWLAVLICSLMLVTGAGRSQAAAQPPLGVYAHIDIVEAIQDIQKTKETKHLCSRVPAYETSQTNDLHTSLQNFYEINDGRSGRFRDISGDTLVPGPALPTP